MVHFPCKSTKKMMDGNDFQDITLCCSVLVLSQLTDMGVHVQQKLHTLRWCMLYHMQKQQLTWSNKIKINYSNPQWLFTQSSTDLQSSHLSEHWLATYEVPADYKSFCRGRRWCDWLDDGHLQQTLITKPTSEASRERMSSHFFKQLVHHIENPSTESAQQLITSADEQSTNTQDLMRNRQH